MSNDHGSNADVSTFESFGFRKEILNALTKEGFESPTPIQALAMPAILDGRDVLGRAQTGTGKTAAFALPVLQNIDTKKRAVQALVLAPTRELAVQICKVFNTMGEGLRGLLAIPVYGGVDFRGQLKDLKRGAHIVVATPGRLIDHLERNSFDLSTLNTLVLDEADEMLRMGFWEEVTKILEACPEDRQTALFSATMSPAIKKVAAKFMRDAELIETDTEDKTAENVAQLFAQVKQCSKTEALLRFLDFEETDSVLVFTRTRGGCETLCEELQRGGRKAQWLNGDLSQARRQTTIDSFKKKTFKILVATDVAARGLDVESVSHVFNFDLPMETDSYVHRIGRTGRAGREGRSISLVYPRETRRFNQLVSGLKTYVNRVDVPSIQAIDAKRQEAFEQKLAESVQSGAAEGAEQRAQALCERLNISPLALSAALLRQASPKPRPASKSNRFERNTERQTERKDGGGRRERGQRGRDRDDAPREKRTSRMGEGFERYRIGVGAEQGMTAKKIAGFLSNEAEIDNRYIQNISISEGQTTLDLPEGMPKEIFAHLKDLQLSGKPLDISRIGGAGKRPHGSRARNQGAKRAQHQRRSPRQSER